MCFQIFLADAHGFEVRIESAVTAELDDRISQSVDSFSRRLGLETKQLSDLLVFDIGTVVIVFRPYRELGRYLTVISNDMRQENSTGVSVNGMELCTDLVSQ